MKRLIIGISGASGVIYGVRILEHLRDTDCETHLILSKSAKLTIEIETSYRAKEVAEMADFTYDNKNMAASISSGSFLTDGMIVAPCTIKTLSGIANSYTDNLLVRAADVSLKEKRKLALLVRETPLHKGHLQLMTTAADLSEIPFKTINDKDASLADYQGKVVLVVNTASKCGLTKQYEGLQKIYKKYKGKDFVVIGFPCNDFGKQEPGDDRQIGAFCKSNYGVEFPMFSKIDVLGADAHPVYAYLTSLPKPIGGPIEWNFQKYLVDRKGNVVARFESDTEPDDPALVSAIDRLLAESETKSDSDS